MKIVIVYENELLLMDYTEEVWKRVVPERWHPYTNEYNLVYEKRWILISTSMRRGKLKSYVNYLII